MKLLHVGSVSYEHTQVPPDEATIEALTLTMYAMAKNVASPALSSVRKRDPFLSFL